MNKLLAVIVLILVFIVGVQVGIQHGRALGFQECQDQF